MYLKIYVICKLNYIFLALISKPQPRTEKGLNRMEEQINKDIKLKKQGLANPQWYFEHDPSKAPEMKSLLEKMRKGNIQWTFGSKAPF